MFEYKAKIVNVVDGDTCDLNFDLGFRLTLKQRCRLGGVNTPELLSSSPEEREKAKEAKKFVEEWFARNPDCIIRSFKPYPDDKYGRYVVYVYPGGPTTDKPLNTALLEAKLAEPYNA